MRLIVIAATDQFGLGCGVGAGKHAISDRARALIPLAVEGFECKLDADTFHAQYDISNVVIQTLFSSS